MILYITIAVVTVLAAGMVKPQPQNDMIISRQQMLNQAALLFIFSTLFIVSALRLNVGNDYVGYVKNMHMVVSDAFVVTEFGYNWLVRIIYGLSGFENFLMVFAVIAFMTIYFFMLTIYRESENFWFTFFLFIVFGFYYQSFSTVRYYLAVAIVLYSMTFVFKQKWLEFVLLVLIAASFHKTALVALPFYFLASRIWNKWALIGAGIFCTTFLFLQDFYMRIMLILYPSYRETDFLEGGTSTINIVRCGGILVFSLIYYRQAIRDNVRNQFYFYCNLGAFALYTFGSFIPIVSRIAYYLVVTHIFFLPAILSRIENKKQRYFFTAAIILAGILYLAIYLYRGQYDGVRILPYKTFLFHELPLLIMSER